MDKVKVILKQLQKYHFWLLCLAAMVTALVGWTMARKSLSAAYEQNKGTIVAKFKSLEGLKAVEDHPNGSWKQGIDELTGQEKKTVGATHETIYNEQNKLLKWPAGLGEKFLEFVTNNPPDAEIKDVKFREIYQNRIKNEFPKLPEIVDAAPSGSAKQQADPRNQAGKPPADAAAEPHDYKVIWDRSSQDHVKESLEFKETPTSIQVRHAQEDLWVYQALLNIIRVVNEGGGYNAPVKQISVIDIGKSAATAFAEGMAPNHIDHLTSAPKGTPIPGVTPGAQQPGAEAGAGEGKPSPDAGRYVDPDGKRLVGGPSASEPFKRMPIYLRLIVDQREIPKLLVQCANSPLPVEVRQLRISPAKQSEGSSPTGAGIVGGGAGRNVGRGASAKSGEASDVYDVPVEMHGIIYIYNKPDLAKTGGQPAAAAAPEANN